MNKYFNSKKLCSIEVSEIGTNLRNPQFQFQSSVMISGEDCY